MVYGIETNRFAAALLVLPAIGIFGAVVFSSTLKKLSYQGKSKTVAGIAGAVFCLWLLHDDMVFPTLLSAFVGGYVFAATLGLLKKRAQAIYRFRCSR